MQQAKAAARTLYYHHFVRYLFVGGTTFVLDFALLFFFKLQLKTSLAVATTVGYWVSIVYNFYLNRWWTFSAAEKASLRRRALAYAVLLGFNYLFTLGFISAVSHVLYFGVAKAIAVIIQMSWSYFIYKKYIFV